MKPSDFPYAEQYSKSGDCSRSRAAAGSVWRPMKDAPRDGTKIIGWWDRFGAKEIFWEHGFVEAQTGIVLHHTNHPRLWVPSPNNKS